MHLPWWILMMYPCVGHGAAAASVSAAEEKLYYSSAAFAGKLSDCANRYSRCEHHTHCVLLEFSLSENMGTHRMWESPSKNHIVWYSKCESRFWHSESLGKTDRMVPLSGSAGWNSKEKRTKTERMWKKNNTTEKLTKNKTTEHLQRSKRRWKKNNKGNVTKNKTNVSSSTT